MLYPAELPGRGRLRAPHYSRKASARSSVIWRARIGNAALMLLVLASSPLRAQTCPAQLTPAGLVLRVGEGLEIELDDGRRVRPQALAPFGANAAGRARAQAARDAASSWLEGQTLFLPAPAPPEDRWGRITAPLHLGGQTGPKSLAEALVGAGLMRVAPLARDPCGRALLAAEARARQAKLGLWADPYYSVLAAANPAAVLARSGEFVIVEGRIMRLGQTSARFYLDFGPTRGVDLSVTVSKQTAKAFQQAGLPVETLPGQRVRLRGFVDSRPGPQIEIGGPEALDVIGRQDPG